MADPKIDDDEITEVGIPYPNKSGEHSVNMLSKIDKRLEETRLQMLEINDPYDPICQVYAYLMGYRDALAGRIPNVPCD